MSDFGLAKFFNFLSFTKTEQQVGGIGDSLVNVVVPNDEGFTTTTSATTSSSGGTSGMCLEDEDDDDEDDDDDKDKEEERNYGSQKIENKIIMNEKKNNFQLYTEWIEERNQILNEFLEKRMGHNVEGTQEQLQEHQEQLKEQENDDEEKENEESHQSMTMDDELSPSQRVETQVMDYDTPIYSQTHLVHRPRGRIPHIKYLFSEFNRPDEASEATKVSSIDLGTSNLNLKLCRIEKVYGLRSTLRMQSHKHHHYFRKDHAVTQEKYQQSDPNDVLPLEPFCPGTNKVNDGPLATIYKHVLSMEVVELENPKVARIRNAIPQMCASPPRREAEEEEENEILTTNHDEKRPHRRIMIFFYNLYAHTVNEFLSGKPSLMLLALKNIPARCILPNQRSDEGDWFGDAQDMSPYCICIGDRSKFCVFPRPPPNNDDENNDDDDDGHQDHTTNTVRGHFEEQGMSFTLALYHHANQVLEGNITPTLIRRKNNSKWKRTESLQKHYSQWENEMKEDRENLKRKQKEEEEERRQRAAAAEIRSNKKRSKSSKRSKKRKRQRLCRPSAPPVIDLGPPFYKLNELRRAFGGTVGGGRRIPKIHVIAVVVSVGTPSLTRQGNHMISFSLVDDSLLMFPRNNSKKDEENPSTRDGTTTTIQPRSQFLVTVVFFRREFEKLPKVVQAGDVILIKGAGVQEYKGEMQLLGREECLFRVFRKRTAAATTTTGHWEIDPLSPTEQEGYNEIIENPPAAASPSSSQLSKEILAAVQLWNWGQERIASNPTMKIEHTFTLSMLRQATQHEQRGGGDDISGEDITVMISSIFPTPQNLNEALPHAFLRVWDGTGASKSDRLPFDNSVQDGDPPNVALEEIKKTIQILKTFDQRQQEQQQNNGNNNNGGNDSSIRNIDPPPSVCGRVVNVAVWEKSHWDFVRRHVRIGQFVRFRNVSYDYMPSPSHRNHNNNNAAEKCIMVLQKSWITILPPQTFEIKRLLESHNVRVLRGEYNKWSGILPLDDKCLEGMELPPAARRRTACNQGDDPVDNQQDRRDNNELSTTTARQIQNAPAVHTLKDCRQDNDCMVHTVIFSIQYIEGVPCRMGGQKLPAKSRQSIMSSFMEQEGQTRQFLFLANIVENNHDSSDKDSLLILVGNDAGKAIFDSLTGEQINKSIRITSSTTVTTAPSAYTSKTPCQTATVTKIDWIEEKIYQGTIHTQDTAEGRFFVLKNLSKWWMPNDK